MNNKRQAAAGLNNDTATATADLTCSPTVSRRCSAGCKRLHALSLKHPSGTHAPFAMRPIALARRKVRSVGPRPLIAQASTITP